MGSKTEKKVTRPKSPACCLGPFYSHFTIFQGPELSTSYVNPLSFNLGVHRSLAHIKGVTFHGREVSLTTAQELTIALF